MYNIDNKYGQLTTAGRVTVVTTLLGFLIFIVAFLFNVGQKEFQKVAAQDSATTTVTVLNTAPEWTVLAFESVESSTSTPTNSGTAITWNAIATDSNSEPYWLLVCSTSATPTPGTSSTTPTCGAGAVQWGVSGTTTSGSISSVSTTSREGLPFSERENWFAYVCDAIDLNARCNTTYSQGLTATNTSPFHVNRVPSFTTIWDTSPADPGVAVVFTSTSSDPDTVGGNDTVKLWVCSTSSYNGTTNSCGGTTLASSTFVTTNATATYTIVIPTQDGDFTAFAYIVDEHGHEATSSTQGTDSVLSVNNVAPTVASTTININAGSNLIITQEAGETTGLALQFITTDNNSCLTLASGEEVIRYEVSLYRTGVGSTTCDALTGTYNPNNCYVSNVASTTWNLSCTATSTPNDCNFANDGIDRTRTFDCTFPLWYVADPTDGGATNTFYSTQVWRAEVAAIDDDFATGTPGEASTARELNSLLAFALDTLAIPYGELEPGSDTGTLSASTTMSATGNVGLDQELEGESMCTTYSGVSLCNSSATSTIPESEQEFATSSLAYGSGTALSSTTQQELEINILKSTSTTTPENEFTYWGIAVPGTITLAGLYTGENTFYAVTGEPAQW